MFKSWVQMVLSVAILGGWPASSFAAKEPLRLSFPEKPPLYFTNSNGAPRGRLIDALRQRGLAAGVTMSFEQRPPKRILAEIEANQTALCSLGWFKTPERERFAKFSRPVYRDRGMVLVATQPAASFGNATSLAQVLASGTWRLGAVSGISYGADLDRLLEQHSRSVVRPTATSEQLLRMVLAGRFALALVTEEELSWFLEQEPGDTRLQRVQLSDLPRQGSQRHIMCSRKTPDAVMRQLDALIGDGLAPTAPGAGASGSPR
ncbi:MAG TPA: transporter substrate-binding domain-containing protein [Burkholderiaceae bacterium]|nr:transporter substrate-binding domain-containing protein [Burkholderiaceae bacterium]